MACASMPTPSRERISEDADYQGVRVTLVAYIERAKIPIQIDIGFGDIVTPAPSETDYPALLEFPGPRLMAYPKETVVAEKFEALEALLTAKRLAREKVGSLGLVSVGTPYRNRLGSSDTDLEIWKFRGSC
jgi:hypothetical protein